MEPLPCQARAPINAGGAGCRCGICLVLLWQVLEWFVAAGCGLSESGNARFGKFGSVMKPRSCGHGAGSTPAAWDVVSRLGRSSSGPVGHGLESRPRDRRGRRFDAAGRNFN